MTIPPSREEASAAFWDKIADDEMRLATVHYARSEEARQFAEDARAGITGPRRSDDEEERE